MKFLLAQSGQHLCRLGGPTQCHSATANVGTCVATLIGAITERNLLLVLNVKVCLTHVGSIVNQGSTVEDYLK